MPLILPGNVATELAGATYNVANSCRFNSADSAYMDYADHPGTTGGEFEYTLSLWVKRGLLGSAQYLYSYARDSNATEYLRFDAGDTLTYYINVSGSNSTHTTTQVFRDCSAWYHIVLVYDAENGTDADKVRIFVNGVRVTSFSTETAPVATWSAWVNDGRYDPGLGCLWDGSSASAFFDGYMAEVVFLDAAALAPTSFGEFNSASPRIWQAIDVSGLTFTGSSSFYLDFKDSADLGDDESGEGNDFNEANLAATDQSTDTPTNNFAIMNPLNYGTNYTWSEGNLELAQTATNWDSAYASIGVTSGKWYMEIKRTAGDHFDVGVTDVVAPTGNISQNSGCVAYKSNSEFARAGSTGGGLPSNVTDPASNTYAVDDIVSIALDVDNEAVYFAVNGTWEVNSDPESGASLTGATTLPNSGSTYFFAFAAFGSPGTGIANFGNPPYANSSDAADADGYGAFEYAPPSGYYALCTKNLAEYG